MNLLTDHLDAALPTLGHMPAALRGPDLPLLVSLDVLLDECNVTRAAARLHLSQPALSAQLARLRLLFDDPLLVPAANGRGLVPSQFALSLHRRLRPALATLTAAIRADVDTFDARAALRCFHIAAANTSAAMCLPALVRRFQSLGNPGLTLAVGEPDTSRLPGQLERGDVDLCIGPACLLPPGQRIAELLTTPHVLVQRRGHPRGTAPVTAAEYCTLAHINVARDSALHGFIDEQLYRLGHTRRVALAVRDFCCVPAMLAAGDLVSTAPSRLAAALGPDVEAADLAFPLTPYTLCMAWHPRGDDDPGLVWLRTELTTALG